MTDSDASEHRPVSAPWVPNPAASPGIRTELR